MNTELPRIEMATKTGNEPFHTDRDNLPQTLLDYWRWSGSDLVSNAQRGILAEFLVGSALQMTVGYAVSGMRTMSGRRQVLRSK